MIPVLQFLFIVVLPLVLVGGGLVTLFAIGALFDLLENPGEARARIEGLFRKPPAAPRAPAKSHFYQAYWTR
jgi:hypothetical protein